MFRRVNTALSALKACSLNQTRIINDVFIDNKRHKVLSYGCKCVIKKDVGHMYEQQEGNLNEITAQTRRGKCSDV